MNRHLTCLLAAGLTAATISAQDAAPPPPAGAGAGADGGGEMQPGLQTAENNAAADEMTRELDIAVGQGLAALVELQNDDGSWGQGRYSHHAGITALACLAFLADGHFPGRGRYGDVVLRGLNFILDNTNETGMIAAENTSHGPMYGHGFCTLFLGEIYGMLPGGGDSALSTRVHDALLKACRLIVQTQNREGGWRYNPVPYDADISVTICQIMALRSARNAGIEIPKSTIDRAVEYVERSQNPDGGFKYQLVGGSSNWPRTGAGVASLYYAGIYSGPQIDNGLTYLMDNALPEHAVNAGSHYFYGHYYAVQAMYLAGGDYWAQWWPAIRDELIDRQGDKGIWEDRHAGDAYGTAMALIILQMPKRYLPIFQK
ncbi:MAG: terpene cyclase/mutase family protein [Phycisphaerales bacterium]|nr:terpene cyclase/mutase family protein [Phycisphaerales bacterium]